MNPWLDKEKGDKTKGKQPNNHKNNEEKATVRDWWSKRFAEPRGKDCK